MKICDMCKAETEKGIRLANGLFLCYKCIEKSLEDKTKNEVQNENIAVNDR